MRRITSDLLARIDPLGHLDYLVSEFIDYYNYHRSHTERDWLPPVREEPDEVETLKLI